MVNLSLLPLWANEHDSSAFTSISIFVPTLVQDLVCCIFLFLNLDVAIAPGRSDAFILYFTTFRGTCAWTGPLILCSTTLCKRPGYFHFHINLVLRLWSKDTSISFYDNGQKNPENPACRTISVFVATFELDPV